MKQLFSLIFLTLSVVAFGQASDTLIYKVAEEAPRFPGCETLDTTLELKNQCSQTSLLYFFNSNIQYPVLAQEKSVEGTVVISFVVEKDGFISNPVVLKDIGEGCGDEAIRVAKAMNDALKESKLTWSPGKNGGKPVRTQVSVPIKFKLLDYKMVGYDTVYVALDDTLTFKGGQAAMEQFIGGHLKYPAAFKDSCEIGTMDMTLLVRPDGLVKVLDVSDYWNLGSDFQFEAIQAATATYKQWNPAKRKGREVPAEYDLTLYFKPKGAHCQQKISDFERADAVAAEGNKLFNEGKQEEGMAKLNEAIALFPDNANFLYLRGQAYISMQKMAEACEDFKKVRLIVNIEMVNQMIPLICK